MSIVHNAKDYREKINRESEIYFCIAGIYTSDTTHPPHHHAATVVAVADSTAGSTGRTRAEHNQ
ncbi:hypothetical protein Tco_1349117, partial [Tanacetum coccineum]